MSLLTVLQDVAHELGLPDVESVIGSTDTTTKQLLALANRDGKEVRGIYQWPQLIKETTITLVADQANYAFPEDLDSKIFDTTWDRTNFWQLIGPVTPQFWQLRKSGITSTTPRKEFRTKGWEDKQLYFHPTPDSDDAGGTIAYEYSSLTWVRPVTWAASTTYLANAYSSYNGNIYQTTAGGVSGSTAPTVTSGSESDGGVSWTYISAPYEKFLADTDVTLLDEDILALGVKWRFLQIKGLDWQQDKAAWQEEIRKKNPSLRGARELSLARSNVPLFITSANVPTTGYGN